MYIKHIINTVPDLLNRIKSDTKEWTNDGFAKSWFRGQSNTKYKLIPAVLRKGNEDREFVITKKFRLLAKGYIELPPNKRLDELLFLMQHHGVPTRLLDWSENPLYALLFAVEKAFKNNTKKYNDAALFAIDPIALNKITELDSGEKFDFFPITWTQGSVLQTIKFAFGTQNDPVDGKRIPYLEKPVAIYPSTIHSRLKDQKGCFTLHGSDNRCISEICRDNLVKEGKLIKYTIPSDSVKELLAELYDMGITYSSIFQDLDGLAKDLKYQFKMKEC